MNDLRRLYIEMTYGQRVVAAVFAGLVGGVCLFAVALVSHLLGDRESFVANYGSLGALFLLYSLGGAAAGLIGGLLLPIAKSIPGAVIVGTVAAAPIVTAATHLASGPFSTWGKTDYAFVLLASAVLGGVGALSIRKRIGEE
jgi:hypothetical protein